MKSPIFKMVTDYASDELRHDMADIERKMTAIVSEHKEALIMAWVAETGLQPSQSVICHGFKDGCWRCWVETKDENDKRAHVAPLYTKDLYQ